MLIYKDLPIVKVFDKRIKEIDSRLWKEEIQHKGTLENEEVISKNRKRNYSAQFLENMKNEA